MRLLSEIPSPKSPMPIRCNFAERLSPRQKMALSAFACVVVALAAVPWRGWLDPANVVMLFLLTVLVVAVGLGRNPAVLAAVLGVLLFDILFVPPHFSLAVSDLQYLITFAVMLATALITGHLAATLQEQAADAGRRERRTRALYEIARQLARNAQDAFALGLQGTPGYLVGPFIVEGALSEAEFLRVIDQARAKPGVQH